jgi:hypothetical protein
MIDYYHFTRWTLLYGLNSCIILITFILVKKNMYKAAVVTLLQCRTVIVRKCALFLVMREHSHD